MTETFVIFATSLLFLIISAYMLLKFSEKLSYKIKISPLIIGVTLVAIGTSLPETFIAVSAINQGAPLISLGDIIGSGIANVCLILGINILLFPVRIGTTKTQKNNVFLFFVTVLFISIFFLPGNIRKAVGIILPAIYVIFLITELVWGKEGGVHEDKKTLAKLEKSDGNPFLYLVGILLAIGGLILSSKYLVSAVISISKYFNIGQEIIGLSLVAIGTSLPELAASISSGIKKDWKLLYGNIQGSNIYNLSIVGAILVTTNPEIYSHDTFSLIFMGIAILSVIILSHKYMGTNIPRKYGIFYIIFYIFYLYKIYNF